MMGPHFDATPPQRLAILTMYALHIKLEILFKYWLSLMRVPLGQYCTLHMTKDTVDLRAPGVPVKRALGCAHYDVPQLRLTH